MALLTLNNVHISGNSTRGAFYNGGGLWLGYAAYTLNGVTLDNNQAGGSGGGMFITAGAVVTMTNVILSNNTAGNGGGVFLGSDSVTPAQATVHMSGVTIRGNHADLGAGIYEQLTSGSVELRGTTLSQNSATANGGAIELNTGSLSIFNSTISGNSATSNGGGIDQVVDVATLTNVTILGNSAPHGGGIHGASVATNTIVADSLAGNNCNSAIGGTRNLSNDASCGFGVGGDAVAMQFLPLANYGGSTQTRLPQSGNPAIDSANDAACPTTDQRGLPRPVGSHCDVGAVELQALDYPFVFLPLISK